MTPRIMYELHRDHVNINKLLLLLETELQKVASGDDMDLVLMMDIVDYVANYPDLVHHPKEDVLYKAFQEKSLEASEIVRGLLLEHVELPQLTHNFYHLLEDIKNGSLIVSREELFAKGQEYAEKQLAHLNTEEALMFPIIKETFDDDDWKSLEAKIPESKDPLFDAELDLYRNILNYLKEREEELEREPTLAASV